MERICNVIKNDKKKSKGVEDNEEMPTLKRSHKAKTDELSRRYPVTMTAAQSAADYETLQQHCKAKCYLNFLLEYFDFSNFHWQHLGGPGPCLARPLLRPCLYACINILHMFVSNFVDTICHDVMHM